VTAYLRFPSVPELILVSPPRERVFNIPGVIVLMAAVMGLVHAVFTFVLTPAQTNYALVLFAFIPVRYQFLAVEPWVTGWGAAVWTFVTYAFIHGGLNHLFFNGVWLLAFGTPVARRFGTLRFTLFFALTAAAGAAVHLVTNFGDRAPVVGASAAVSGAMAAAIRFVFQRGGPLGALRVADEDAYRVPAAPLLVALRDSRILIFLAVWFGLNLIFGLGLIPMPGVDMAVAWEAHIGGFLAGLLCFPLFDPVRHSAANVDAEPPPDPPEPGTTIH
jgi:membrane associated rhomboid family serine protease